MPIPDNWSRTGAQINRESRRFSSILIASGASVQSGFFDLGDHTMLALLTPSGIAGSQFSFQAGTHEGSFYDLYNDGGTEVLVTHNGPNRMVAVDLNSAGFGPLRYLKIRSGPTASANAQADTKTIDVITKA